MKKYKIILLILTVYVSLMLFFIWITRTIKDYSSEQEKSNVLFAVYNQVHSIQDRVFQHATKLEMINAINNGDTAWIADDIQKIIDDYDVSNVAIINQDGKVALSRSRNSTNYSYMLERDFERYCKGLYFSNILVYHHICMDSVFTIIVSKVKSIDNLEPAQSTYFAVVDCLNETLPNKFVVKAGRDTLNESFLKPFMKVPLMSPESKVEGYAECDYSPEFYKVYNRIHNVYLILMYSVVALLIVLAIRYYRTLARQKKDQDELSAQAAKIKQTSSLSDFYHNALDQSFVGIVVIDPLGKIEFANRAFEQASGYTQAELKETQPMLFTDQDESPIFNYEFFRRLSNGTAWKGNLFCIRKDNSKTFLHATFSPVRTNGYATGYTAIFEDAENSLSMVEQLKIVNLMYSSIVDYCDDTIWIYDYKDRRFKFVNQSVKKLTGFLPEQILGQPLVSMMDQESYIKVSTMFAHFISNEHITVNDNMKVDCKVKCSDGTFKDVQMSITPFAGASGKSDILAITRDTTEHQSVLRRLSESETKYRMIVENTADLLWKIDAQTYKFNYVSSAVINMFGYTPEEFTRLGAASIVSGATYERIMRKSAMLAAKSYYVKNHRFRCTVDCKNGDQKELESVVSVISTSNGRKEFLGVSHDITESTRYERKLNDTLSQLKILIETLPTKIFMKDNAGKFIVANNSFAEGLNTSLDKIIGATAKDLPIPSDAEILVQQDEDILRTGIRYLNQEVFIHSAKGQGKWFSVSQVPYKDGETVLGIIGIMVDITNQKLYEKVLQENNRQFEKTITNFNDAYLKMDIDGVILMANPSACEIIGVESQIKIIGANIKDMILTDFDLHAFGISIEKSKQTTFKFHNNKGQDIYCEASVSKVTDKDGNMTGYECLARNITDRKLHEQQLNIITQDLMHTLEQTKIQKNMIESAHRGITESLNYAKRIQDALLKSSFENISNYMPQSFIMYEPREIVGGDFVYVCQYQGGIVCAVGDCTGHGIPGALMSVLAISLLNDIFGDNSKVYTPADVLEQLRSRIITTLSNSLILRDGLDICLLMMPENRDRLVYSGANTPLYIARDGEIITLKPVRCPIGLYPVQSKFENVEFQIHGGDMIYLSSDGYPDQFGIKENRKFSQKDFMELLANISGMEPSAQKTELENSLTLWRGSRKQTDDITVFGIRG